MSYATPEGDRLLGTMPSTPFPYRSAMTNATAAWPNSHVFQRGMLL